MVKDYAYSKWSCFFQIVQLFSKEQMLDSSKQTEFADDKFRFDENGRKFFKWVENSVVKGEIARYEQFLLSHGIFKRIVL